MKLILATDEGQPLVTVPFTETKVIRCIKRDRRVEYDEERKPKPFPPITQLARAKYVGSIVLPTGDSWENIMLSEDAAIQLEEIKRTPGDLAGAEARAAQRIADLNDPSK